MSKTLLLCAMLFGLFQAAPSSAAGVTDSEIRIGASAVLSGPLGAQTTEYGVGARLCFEAVNAAGGVHGRKIVYKTLDDAFDVPRAVDNTKRLLNEDQVFLIFNNTGTAHTAAILPITTEAKTIVFGPVTGATALRQKVNHYLFHVRAGYADEAARIARQLQQVGITRVAAFYQDDGLGRALMAEVRAATAAQKLQLTEARVEPGKGDFAAAAADVAKAQPQAVIMATAGSTFTAFAKALRAAGAHQPMYGFSVVSVDAVKRDLGPAARGIVLAQIMPSLINRSTPVVNEYFALLKASGDDGDPSLSRFEGFMHAKLLVEGLRRAGRGLTTESLINAFESAGELAFGKFSVAYSPQSHSGSKYVELAIIDAEGKLRY
jgi:ABC-type branched-subunit amino acid transport system substrate-binding protein